jgi:two-component system, LytTR family, response regulator
MKSLKVLVADDESLARARLKRLVEELGHEVCAEAADGLALLKILKASDCDVVLLDVEMPKLTGAEALALWPEGGPPVVLCTAHAQFAIEAFEFGALDFVVKPVTQERLQIALTRVLSRREAFHQAVAHYQLKRLALPTRQGVVLVDCERISHASLEGELVTVFVGAEKHLSDLSLSELAERLPSGRFERVHRKTLLNLEWVTRLESLETGGYMAITQHGHRVEISRASARELRVRLGLRKPSTAEEGAPDDP